MIGPSCLITTGSGPTAADQVGVGDLVIVWPSSPTTGRWGVLAAVTAVARGGSPTGAVIVGVEEAAFVADAACPVLTVDGWKPAGRLTGGDRLVDGHAMGNGPALRVTGLPVPLEPASPVRYRYRVAAVDAAGVVTASGAVIGAAVPDPAAAARVVEITPEPEPDPEPVETVVEVEESGDE